MELPVFKVFKAKLVLKELRVYVVMMAKRDRKVDWECQVLVEQQVGLVPRVLKERRVLPESVEQLVQWEQQVFKVCNSYIIVYLFLLVYLYMQLSNMHVFIDDCQSKEIHKASSILHADQNT